MNEKSKPRRVPQPPVFWLTLVGAAVGAALFAATAISRGPENSGPLLGGAAMALALAVLVVGGFALDIFARMRHARSKLPDALLIPITVGMDLSAATNSLARLIDNQSIRLRQSSYATVAVDGTGVRLIGNGNSQWAVVPAADVTVAGFTQSILGVRSMQAIVLRVVALGQTIDLPIVPMRLRGNPVRALNQSEMDELVDAITKALNGGSGKDWKA